MSHTLVPLSFLIHLEKNSKFLKMEKLAKQLEKKLDLANVLKIKEKTENELSHRLKYCTFCKIVSPDEHNQIIFQNELLVIFDDIKKIKNVNHLLAVPKNHVKDINKAGFLKISDKRKCSTCSVMLPELHKTSFDPFSSKGEQKWVWVK